MRRLMWIGVGVVLACLFCAYLYSASWLMIPGAILLLLAVAGLIFLKKPLALRCAAFALLGLSIGVLWFQLFGLIFLKPIEKLDQSPVVMIAEATDYSRNGQYGSSVDASVELEGKRYSIRLYLDGITNIAPGDKITGEFDLKYTGAAGMEASTYHSGAGIFLLGYERGESYVMPMQDRSLIHFPARLRQSVVKTIDRIFPSDTAPLAKALLVGDRTDMDYSMTTDFSVTGILHLVAVSGMHVSVLFSLLYLVFGRNRLITPILGTIFLIFVAAVSGFTPSIVRACLMNGIVLLAMLFNRESDGYTALGFSMIVMLTINPFAITSAGLQLSAASVLGILLVSDDIYDWVMNLTLWGEPKRGSVVHRIRNAVAAGVSVSIGATIATAPLTVLYFGSVSLVGVLTNLLTVTITNYLFLAIIVAVIVGAICLPCGIGVAWVISWGLRYIIWLAGVLGSFPLAAVYTESVYIVVWLIFTYAAVIVYAFMKERRFWHLIVSAVMTLAVALLLSYTEPYMDRFRVTLVDVGQGQCVLLQWDGKNYMVDCGGEDDEEAADKAIALLYSQGVFHLDGVIVTHFDYDHVGGVPYVLSRIRTDAVYIPAGFDNDEMELRIRKSTNGMIYYLSEDETIRSESGTIQIFVPEYWETSNESSLCVLFQKDNCDILITGDQPSAGEADLILSKDIPDIEILVAGHHGSDSSSSSYFLEQIRPEIVLISVGAKNRYGHPSQSVLERLAKLGCEIRRTDEEGTIIIRR